MNSAIAAGRFCFLFQQRIRRPQKSHLRDRAVLVDGCLQDDDALNVCLDCERRVLGFDSLQQLWLFDLSSDANRGARRRRRCRWQRGRRFRQTTDYATHDATRNTALDTSGHAGIGSLFFGSAAISAGSSSGAMN